MEKMNRSRIGRIARWAGFLVLCAGVTGEMCLEERGIDIVVGANIQAEFEARGEQNRHFDEQVIDLVDNADIESVLEQNGFEGKVLGRIESAFYRVTKRDSGAPTRTVSGMVTADGIDLIPYESVQVNAPALAGWIPAPLDSAGVAYLNGVLEGFFLAIANNETPPTTEVTFRVEGTSEPQSIPTDFDWEIRVKLVLVGKKYVSVPDPL